jgi:C4-dicarboxylate-specific signal transduction histidine kinase
MALDGDRERNLFALVVKMARVEERLVAQDAREKAREHALAALVRDAVREGLEPVHERLDALEKDVAAVRTTAKAWVMAGGVLTTFAAGLAWALEYLPKIIKP